MYFKLIKQFVIPKNRHSKFPLAVDVKDSTQWEKVCFALLIAFQKIIQALAKICLVEWNLSKIFTFSDANMHALHYFIEYSISLIYVTLQKLNALRMSFHVGFHLKHDINLSTFCLQDWWHMEVLLFVVLII